MRWSKIFHFLSCIFGIFGFLSLVFAWLAGENGRFLELSQNHLFNDAIILTLISITSGVAAIYHKWEEIRS